MGRGIRYARRPMSLLGKAVRTLRRLRRTHDSGPRDDARAGVGAPREAAPKTATPVAKPGVEELPMLGNHPIQVFGRDSCLWTGRAKRLLRDRKLDFEYVELVQPEDDALHDALIAHTKQNTVPYVFIRGELVGGFQELDEVDRLGQLEARVLGRPVVSPTGTKIVIATGDD